MQRIGLALSGGGFRAAIYHLGVLRFLRDADILPKISHITCVSGGSVTGAHLALNWDRYCGSASEFEQAAGEVIRFVQMDVRNRIVRRFPLASALNSLRRLVRLPAKRHLTRAGLLEKHYEDFLFGDASLFQLPDRPRLHILSTNLSEGCLCSFFQGGLLLQRRAAGRRDAFEKVEFGLATIPMAVSASSAFPGFFPPLELHGWDVGMNEGEFSRMAFTDGGVIDNLGLRMFRCIEQSWIRDITPLGPDDIINAEAMMAALHSEVAQSEDNPLGRLRVLLRLGNLDREAADNPLQSEVSLDRVIDAMWEVIQTSKLYHDPVFKNVEPEDPNAQSLINYVCATDYELDLGDQLWLNRQMIDAAFRQVAQTPCLRVKREGFDTILVSDAGATFKVSSDTKAGGIITTAMRSSDIAMDRVYQLELEAFHDTERATFMPMTEIVTPAQDPHAPHPEIQRQASRIRTDMDRFSDLEISALIQHAYCVARKQCKNLAAQLEVDVPDVPPWDPFADGQDTSDRKPMSFNPLNDKKKALSTARDLRSSAKRRTWSTVFSFRDWPTYVWIPLIACVALSLPYLLYKSNKRAQQQQMVLSAISETSPLYREILELLESGPRELLEPTPFTEVDEMKPVDHTGFEIVEDSRIYDLRRWSSSEDSAQMPFVHQRVRIRRTDAGQDNSHLRIQTTTREDQLYITCKTERLEPKVSRMRKANGSWVWEFDFDFSRVPLGTDQEVVLEGHTVPELAEYSADQGRIAFTIFTDTGLAQVWMLMPEGRSYEYFEMSTYPLGQPELAKVFVPDTTVDLPLGAIVMFRIIDPDSNHRYDCHWKWQISSEAND